jgi:uncharacterized peroxidase-related enzyme
MQTLKSLDPASATRKTKQIFDSLQKALGTVPNSMRTLANSPAALNAYMSFNAALGEAKLPAPLREQLAIAVANVNSCDYCLSAHTALGKLAGLATEDLALAQNAEASNVRTSAALRFAADVVRKRGLLAASEVETLRGAGFTDAEIVEIIAVVAINIFTNYFNHIAGTEIDFPIVHSDQASYQLAGEKQ